MDSEERLNRELQRGKWLLIAGLWFLISCFFVYDEIAFRLWGREAEATITKVYETTSRRGGTQLVVDFTFVESNNTVRRGTVKRDPDWPVPSSGKVTVEYTPGELGRARIKGQVYWYAIIIFAGGCIAVGVAGFVLWREANEDLPPVKVKERKK